jgi:anthranilate synthase component 2
MKVLVFDNYDSFTYNLVQMVERLLSLKVDVIRNDRLQLEEAGKYDKIILSPGPGIPSEAGLLLPLIDAYKETKSILGVCLGHQAIGEVYGGKLINLDAVFHGVATPVKMIGASPLFKGMGTDILAGRYHSWVVERDSLPAALEVTAEDENGLVMAMQHSSHDVMGVQFHPESVLTPEGETMLRNWLFR